MTRDGLKMAFDAITAGINGEAGSPEEAKALARSVALVAYSAFDDIKRIADALESIAASNNALMHHYVGADANGAKVRG